HSPKICKMVHFLARRAGRAGEIGPPLAVVTAGADLAGSLGGCLPGARREPVEDRGGDPVQAERAVVGEVGVGLMPAVGELRGKSGKRPDLIRVPPRRPRRAADLGAIVGEDSATSADSYTWASFTGRHLSRTSFTSSNPWSTNAASASGSKAFIGGFDA
ncbi:hypothetical protein ACU686_37005, partial [Yinghuangia aomiensis]